MVQLRAVSPDRGLELARGLIRAKIADCIGNFDLWPDTQTRRYTEHKLLGHLETLDACENTRELMVIEATAALSYFRLWQEIPLNWTAKSERSIPGDWTFIAGRESKVSGINRNASHPVNAILNYAYAALESQVRIAASTLGFDTSVSYLHAMKHGRSSLIFDMMQPVRPRA